MIAGCYLNENWEEVPLPIYTLPPDHLCHCDRHGDFNPHAYYTDTEIAEDLSEQGRVDCPYCLQEICNE
jgi:hypothetical protein